MPSLENTYQQCSTTTPPMLWWLLMTRVLTLHSSLLISGGRETHQPGVVGHRWAGGLRQTQASLIPTNCKVSWICIQLIIILISSGCFPHLFLPREPGQFRERSSQVVSWSETPLSSGSDHPGWYKAGPERGQGDHRQVEGEKVSSHHLPPGKISETGIILESLIFLITGVSHGQGCWSSQVSGVFCPHSEGPQDSLRRGYQSCSMPCPKN